MSASEAGAAVRRDAVVVMGRGASRRYGSPKALARAGDDPRPMLERVAAAFSQGLACEILVVTTVEQRDACEDCLAELPGVRVVGGPSGGDTALTLALAWERLAPREPAFTHIWAHPVDVPGISARTIAQLARVSALVPARAVRPSWGGQPGHPLVVPAALMALLAAEAAVWPGPWRALMDRAAADGRCERPLLVAVADPGVVLDHDEPESPGRSRPAKGGNDGD